jgi:hypothetical protein
LLSCSHWIPHYNYPLNAGSPEHLWIIFFVSNSLVQQQSRKSPAVIKSPCTCHTQPTASTNLLPNPTILAQGW